MKISILALWLLVMINRSGTRTRDKDFAV